MQQKSSERGQRGFAVITLAVIGLVATGLLAVPALTMANFARDRQFDEASLASLVGSGAPSGAEHAIWRIANDPEFLSSMTGTPPQATYELDLPGGTTTITVVAASEPPVAAGLRAVFSLSPSVAYPDSTSTATFTMTVINDDSVAHGVTRVETNPHQWSPSYVDGSTTGFTTVDPTITGWWRWDLSPPVSVPPFGGEITMQYDVIASESWGTYWTTGQVHVDGVCTIEAPTTARLRFMELDNLSIETTVSPDVISAGAAQTFTYTVEVANSSSTAMTLRWIRHYMDDGFDYLPGTTSGSSVADPDIWWNPVAGRYTHEWAFGGAPIPAYSNVTISFDVSAALLPGVYTARSSMKVEEDQGSVHKFHDLSSFETGETAPITARRAYSITASQGGVAIDVEALLLSSGVEILSWLGS